MADDKRLDKCHSLLSTSDITASREENYSTFDGVNYIETPITYDEFFCKYLLPNKLCLIGPWLTSNWLSRDKWVSPDGSPDLNYLQQQFGSAKCPIADCKKEEYGSHPKSEMLFTEFVDYLQRYKESGYSDEMPCYYLKDWHCVRCFPSYKAYTTPVYFQSDWLNEFWDQRSDNVCDDYKFVYIGPKGSWTPFHSDVLRSYSWSANICGCKKWIFYPPGEEEHLKDRYGKLPYDLTAPDLLNCALYPHVDKVTKRFEVIQNPGEVVFVPSGWHHQVFNMEDTISINHNWMNGCNLDICWEFLYKSHLEVMEEISDCRDMEGWESQCQLILKASSGMDYMEFYKFMELIATNRIKVMENHPGIEKSHWAKSVNNIRTEFSEPRCQQVLEEVTGSLVDKEVVEQRQDMAQLGSLTFEYQDDVTSHTEANSEGLPTVHAACSKDNNTDPRQLEREKEGLVSEECSSNRNENSTNGKSNISAQSGKTRTGSFRDETDLSDTQRLSSESVKAKSTSHSFDNLHINHILFDLIRIQTVLEIMLKDEYFAKVMEEHCIDFNVSPSTLLDSIKEIINESDNNVAQN